MNKPRSFLKSITRSFEGKRLKPGITRQGPEKKNVDKRNLYIKTTNFCSNCIHRKNPNKQTKTYFNGKKEGLYSTPFVIGFLKDVSTKEPPS